jgi:hypothetical protein
MEGEMSRNRLTRRTFLRSAATAATGALAGPYVITSTAFGSATTPPASERITIGHIGVGGQGGAVLGSYLHCEGSQSVAVCDPFKSRRDEQAELIDEFYAERIGKGN